ncbi:MAG: HEPN domain-containing protein [Bacilli bacterium]|nr:HEPN domain-containing protein [Bacilli bacterium]
MCKNVLKSDATLLIPTIFNSYQSLELFLKGLLLLNGVKIENAHKVRE